MCFEDLLKFVKVSIVLALRGGEYGEIAPEKQMDMLQEAEVYTMPLRRMAGDAGNAEVTELLTSLYKSMAIVVSSGKIGDAAASRAKTEIYVNKARKANPDDEEASGLLPKLLEKLEVSFLESTAAERDGAVGSGGEKGGTDKVQPKQISNWIDVIKYAEFIEGWKTSFEELLQLARLLNATLVEPCMNNGRLASCAKMGVPLSDIFDLASEMAPVTPLVASYDEYKKLVQHEEQKKYKVCIDNHATVANCQASNIRIHQVNKTELFEGLGDNRTVVSFAASRKNDSTFSMTITSLIS